MLTEQSNLKENIYNLTDGESKNWLQLLQYGQTLNLDEKRLYLWAWPTVDNLEILKKIFIELNIDRILSIGCGNGLFEWIIQESLGMNMYGLELDCSWWQSKYSIKQFINVNYVDNQQINGDFLQHCCNTNKWDFALLFCYFNNREAFHEYLRHYQGVWIIIIGPTTMDLGIHTDPSPMEPNFPNPTQWELKSKFNIAENNSLVIYKRFND